VFGWAAPINKLIPVQWLRSEFLRQVASTLSTRIALIALGVVSSVLVARALGPQGRGVLALAGAVTAVGVQLGNFGLHASNTWAIAKERSLLGALIANSLLLSIVIGGAEAGLVGLLSLVRPDVIPLSGPILAIALIGIPLSLGYLLLQNLLLGLQRVRDYNLVEIAARVLGIVASASIIVVGLASPLNFLAVGTSILVFVTAAMVWRLLSIAAAPRVPRLRLLREYGRFGMMAYTASLLSFLVLRSDLFLVESYLGVEAVGYYSIAVAFGDLAYTPAVVIGTLLFPRLASMREGGEQARYAKRVVIRVAITMAVLVSALAVLSPFLIEVLFGTRFLPALPALLWLMPGIALLSVHTIIMNYLAAAGYPSVSLVSPFTGLFVNVATNLALLPSFGIIGASIASTIAYGVMLAISTLYFFRRTSMASPGPSIRGGAAQ
jgi:O-antigen/teichoic acid export membrane protein